MEGTQYTTKEALLRRALEIKGIPLRNVDKTGRLQTGKGAIGTVIEESWFGYTPNSESEPDFPEAGVELKVTPYIKTSVGIRAKERLVCNIINYMEEYSKTFESSAFYKKCNTMLLMSYQHLFDVPKGDYKIDEAVLFGFPEEDLIIIEHDWNIIIEKVRAGKAHEISEGDTLYLSACTKGATAKSVRRQPFSDIPAKQRAYSLKASYMTQILNKYIFGNEENPKIIKSTSLLKNRTFEEYVIDIVSKYYGKSQEELMAHFGIKKKAKSINEILLAKMFDVTGKIAQTEEFKKAGIIPKTIRVEESGKIRESMSFPSFDFIELSKEKEWEESKFYNSLAPVKFMFVIYKKNKNKQYVFDRVKFWNIPECDLEEAMSVWERTKKVLNEGVKFVRTSNGVKNNLPKKTENRVAHVRPHAKDSEDTLLLPNGERMPKQCFWLNNTYIAEQIKE